MSEQVDHPAHYGGADNAYETIKVLRAWLTPAEFVGFLRGNVIKYLSRAGKKGSACRDYAKAAWYQTEMVKLGTVLDEASQPKRQMARPANQYDQDTHGRVLWCSAQCNVLMIAAGRPGAWATHWTPVERPIFPDVDIPEPPFWPADEYAG